MTKPTAKPFLPPTIYRDALAIYLEWPTLCLRFEFCQNGLAKALKHIPNVANSPGYNPGGSNIVASKLIRQKSPKVAKTTTTKREIANFSEDERRAANDALDKILKGVH